MTHFRFYFFKQKYRTIFMFFKESKFTFYSEQTSDQHVTGGLHPLGGAVAPFKKYTSSLLVFHPQLFEIQLTYRILWKFKVHNMLI